MILPFSDSKLNSILGYRAALTLALSRRERGRFVKADGRGFDAISTTGIPLRGCEELVNPRGTESGTVDEGLNPFDADLRLICDIWPNLPEAIRSGIMAMVKTAVRT